MKPSAGKTQTANLAALKLVDKMCSQFEEAWLAEKPVSIESCLGELDADCAALLFEQLLAMELEYVENTGRSLNHGDYLLRFPQYADAIHSLFAKTNTSDNLATLSAGSDNDTLVGEDYELIEEIGRGGMGVVYRARQKSLNCEVALKMVSSSLLPASFGRERFRLEAEAAAKVKHKRIVPIHSVGDWNGNCYYTMDLVEGVGLDVALTERGHLPQKQAAEIVEKIARAVHFAHSRGVIHRDIKPANIILDHDEEPWLTDFGLAKDINANHELTMTGQIVGTASFMAPEQARPGKKSVSTYSDVYSLGATLYALLSGHPPFDANSLLETLDQVVQQSPPALSTHVQGISIDLQAICEKCLGKQPEHRYKSAAELADELQRFIEGRPIETRNTGTWTRVSRWCGRNRLVASLIGATAVSLILGIAISSWLAVRANMNFRSAKDNALVARDAIKTYLSDVSQNELLNEPGLQPLREQLLTGACEFYEQMIIGGANGTVTERDLAEARFLYSKVQRSLGRLEESHQSLLDAESSCARLSASLVGDPSFIELRSRVLNALGQSTLALNADGTVSNRGKVEQDVLSYSDRTLELRNRLRLLDSNNSESERLLANAQMNRASFLAEFDRSDEALSFIDAASATRRAAMERFPDDSHLKLDFAKGCYNGAQINLARARRQSGTRRVHLVETALKSIDEAVSCLRLVKAGQVALETSENTALCHLLKADTNVEFHNVLTAPIEVARRNYGVAITAYEQLSDENPNVSSYLFRLSDVYSNFAQLELMEGNNDEAVGLLENSFDQLLMILRRDSQNTGGLEKLQHTAIKISGALESGNPTLALAVLTTAIRQVSNLPQALRETDLVRECLEQLTKKRNVLRPQG